MKPLDEAERSPSSVDPASIDLGRGSSITIDISGLLRAQANDPVKDGVGRLDAVQQLVERANVSPLIGLISRSVDFALGFVELPHFRILILLSEQDSISVAEIVRAMKMPSRKTLTLLDSMEGAGWIYTAAPGRGMTEAIAISEQGRSLVDDVTAKRQGEIDEILGRMSEPDRAAIATAFSSFANAAREPAIRRPKNGVAR